MNNAERRRIVQEAKMNGYQGSYVDLFKQAAQNPDSMQKSMFTAVTPEQKEQGLRPLHEAGRTDASMAFPDVPPNTPFNTVGMKAPIDIKKYDKQGHLVKSYESVPPGIQNLDTGPNEGTVIETPTRMQEGGTKENNPKFGISKNLLERLGTYGKTRQEAEKDPYYEGRIDISKDDAFDFLIRNLRDSMTDQQKSDMLNQMAKVRVVKEGEPVYKSVEGRAHFDPLNNRVNLPEYRMNSLGRGSVESEEFIHSLQRLGRFNPSDYGVTEENKEDYLPGGKEDLPNRYMPFMSLRKSRGSLAPLTSEVQQLIDLNPEGISDDVYYGGKRNPKETEAMLFSGLMHANKMGIIPEGQTITERDIPEILKKFDSLNSHTSIRILPDHAERLHKVLENAQNLKPGSKDLLLKILNQNITIGNTRMQKGGGLDEAARLIREHNLKEDSTFENIVEMFDPTGISAWDDAYRAYTSMKERGASYPNMDEALDMLGAVPVMGKAKAAVNLYKKSNKPIRYGLTEAYNKIFRHTGRAASIIDGIEDETGFLDSKEQNKPVQRQGGGFRLKKDAMEMFPALKALGNVKVKADKKFTKDLTGIGDIEYFAPGQKAITYPSGARVKHPGSDRRHTVLVNPETNNAQNVALDMLHGLPAEDPKYNRLVQEFGEALGEDDPKHFYELARKEGLAEDGYDQYRQNYIDGKIRNLLFQGSEEDFKKAIYNPEERQQIQEYNPGAYEKFLEIERHLKSPRKKQQRGGYNPGEYMNEMQPKVFPNQKRDAQWVNYTTEHDFAGRFPGETKSNRELGLEISNRNTVPLPPTPTVPKELRVRAQQGATRQDSLDVYNNAVAIEKALKQQGYDIFRNSFPTTGEWEGVTDKEKKQFAKNVKEFYEESFGAQKYKDDYDAWVASGEWKQHGTANPPSYNWWMGRNTIEPVDENRVRTREMSATSLNMDLPTQLLDSRINPQGFAIGHKTFKQYNPDEHNLTRGYTEATNEKKLVPHSETDWYDPTEFVTQYGDTIKGANRQTAEDQLQHLISMYEKYSDQEDVRPIPSDSRLITGIRTDIDDLVSFPYYDPIMVKPYDMLTDKEKAERARKTKRTTPQRSKTKIEKTLTASMQEETPQRPRVVIPEPLTPLGVGRNQTPKRDILIKQYGSKSTGRKPELIMRTNQGMRTGQEPNYYKVWDKKRKQWSTRPVEPEELDRYRKENKIIEPIVTPPISFQTGGPKSGDPKEEGKQVLSLSMIENYMSQEKGGNPEMWRAAADTIGYHESSPWYRMDPKARQYPEGPGRGLFQFEGPSLKTAQQRHKNIAKQMGVSPDPEIMNATSADQLSREKQYLLFQGNLLESPAKLADYASGNMSLEDLWLKGHKRKEAKGDRAAFEESRLDAKKNLSKYPSGIGVKPAAQVAAERDTTRTISPELQRAIDIIKRDNSGI